MNNELKCPYCNKLLHCSGTQYIDGHVVAMWCCTNYECEQSEYLIGTREMWEIVAIMIQAKQDLEQSEKCCSAWETQALDYKAETIALSGKLEIARKALEELWQATHYDTDGYLGKTIQKALEQIEQKD